MQSFMQMEKLCIKQKADDIFSNKFWGKKNPQGFSLTIASVSMFGISLDKSQMGGAQQDGLWPSQKRFLVFSETKKWEKREGQIKERC